MGDPAGIAKLRSHISHASELSATLVLSAFSRLVRLASEISRICLHCDANCEIPI